MPDPMSFSITGSDGSVGSQNTECTTDWITIPCATNSLRPDNQSGGSPAVCVDRICGMVFNSVNSDFPSPSVPVNSKYKDACRTSSVFFCQLQPCFHWTQLNKQTQYR